jgi:putative hydrolase of the HAD superfamily
MSTPARRPALLLLDAGGVLVSTGGVRDALALLAAGSDASPRELWDLWLRVRPDFWCGRLSHDGLWEYFDAALGVRSDHSALEAAARAGVVPLMQAAPLDALALPKWVLSNHRTPWLLPVLAMPDVPRLDRVAISDQIGACKPDPEAYRLTLADWDGDPATVLVIDDKQRNLDAAARLGLSTMLADPHRAWVKDLVHACTVTGPPVGYQDVPSGT